MNVENRTKCPRSNAAAIDLTNKKSRSAISNRPLNSTANSKQSKLRATRATPDTRLRKTKVPKHTVLKAPSPVPSSRPKTWTGTKIVHFSNVVDRFHPGSPTSQIHLSKAESTECEQSNQNQNQNQNQNIEKTPPTADYLSQSHPLPQTEACTDRCTGTAVAKLTSTPSPIVTDDDFEFMNKSFNYDNETSSVAEFSIEDFPMKCRAKLKNGDCLIRLPSEANSYQSVTLFSFLKSVMSSLSDQIFGSVGDINLLTNVTHVGKRIFRDVTDVFFRGAAITEEENTILTYNGYSIKTIGRSISVNSVLFGGQTHHQLRVLVEIKELDSPVLDQTERRTRKPKLVIGIAGARWTLTKRNEQDEMSGMLEVRVPRTVPVSKIKIKGPYKGVLCINIP